MNDVSSLACPITAGTASVAMTRDASRSVLRWAVLGAAGVIALILALTHSTVAGAQAPANCIPINYGTCVVNGTAFSTGTVGPTYVAPNTGLPANAPTANAQLKTWKILLKLRCFPWQRVTGATSRSRSSMPTSGMRPPPRPPPRTRMEALQRAPTMEEKRESRETEALPSDSDRRPARCVRAAKARCYTDRRARARPLRPHSMTQNPASADRALDALIERGYIEREARDGQPLGPEPGQGELGERHRGSPQDAGRG